MTTIDEGSSTVKQEKEQGQERRQTQSSSCKDSEDKAGCGGDTNSSSSGTSRTSGSSGTRRAGYNADCSSMSNCSDSSSDRSIPYGPSSVLDGEKKGTQLDEEHSNKGVSTSTTNLNLKSGSGEQQHELQQLHLRQHCSATTGLSLSGPTLAPIHHSYLPQDGQVFQPIHGHHNGSNITDHQRSQEYNTLCARDRQEEKIDMSSVKLVHASSLVNGLLSSQIPQEVKYLNHDGVVDGTNSKVCQQSPDLVDDYITLLKSCNPFFDSYMSMVQDKSGGNANTDNSTSTIFPEPPSAKRPTNAKREVMSNYEGDDNSDGSSMVVLAGSRRIKRTESELQLQNNSSNDKKGSEEGEGSTDSQHRQTVLDNSKLNGRNNSLSSPLSTQISHTTVQPPSTHDTTHDIRNGCGENSNNDIPDHIDENNPANNEKTRPPLYQQNENQNQSENSTSENNTSENNKNPRFVTDTTGTNTATTNNGSGSNTGSGNDTFGAVGKRESNGGSTNSQESNQDSEENDKKNKSTALLSANDDVNQGGERHHHHHHLHSPQYSLATMKQSNTLLNSYPKSPSSRGPGEGDSITSTQERLALKKRKRMDMRKEYEDQRQYQGSTSESGDSIKEELFKPGYPVSLEEVLSFTTTARLVASSSPPYIIIHINAAFSRLMDIHSAVGKSLFSIMREEVVAGNDNIENVMKKSTPFDRRLENNTATGDHDDTISQSQQNLEQIMSCCGYGQFYIVYKRDIDQTISVQISQHHDSPNNTKHTNANDRQEQNPIIGSMMSICPIVKADLSLHPYTSSNHDQNTKSAPSSGNSGHSMSNSSCNSNSNKKQKNKHDRSHISNSTTHYLFQFQAIDDSVCSSGQNNPSVTSANQHSESGENENDNQRDATTDNVAVLTCA